MNKQILSKVLAGILLLVIQQGHAQLAPGGVQPGQLDNAIAPRDNRPTELTAPQISERQAVALAQQHFTGNILRISLVGQGANLRYQIRMENEGKIFTVFVNAMTGAVSGG